MRLPIAGVALGAIASLLGSVSAGQYYVDPDSCGDRRDFVRQAVVNAFSLAQSARRSVDATQNQPNQDIQNLMTWMFGSVQQGTRFVRRMFTGNGNLLDWNNESPTNALNENDIWIFCDESRLKETKEFGYWYDETAKDAMETDGKGCNFPTLMYTTQTRTKGFWEIQICPPFLDYGMKSVPKFTASMTKEEFKSIAWNKVGIPLGKKFFKAIDAASLFDKVMLHEITHTLAGGFSHLEPSGAGYTYAPGTTDVGGFNGYGWDKCKELSQKFTDVSTGVDGPENNADTWGLYASAAHLIINAFAQVTEDGNVQQVLTKRGFWKSFIA